MASALGEFLRARRGDPALEPPVAAGAPPARRRVRGLRREEVATAAGVSVDYYTRLEQGREVHPSPAILDALARVLQLTPDAREHLHRLRDAAGRVSPAVPAGSGDQSVDDALLARMTALVESVRPHPAYVLDRLSNVVAANPEGLALHGFGTADGPRNTCRYLLTDTRAQEVFVEWEELARGAVAHLRAANADALDDPQLQTLVSELSDASPLFARWWGEHVVERRRSATKHLRLPDGSVVARHYEVLHLPEDGLRMTLWLPALSWIDAARDIAVDLELPPRSLPRDIDLT